VVNYLKELKGVETVHLVAWSLGGPRSIGYTLLHPENIGNIVLLAPAYRPDVPAAVTQSQLVGAAFTKQSRDDFDANWDRQVGCENQYDLAVSDAVWQAILESDPVGATWGAGVRRAPRTPMVGMSPTDVGSVNKSVLMIVGEHDAQVVPQRVRDFYADLGSENKVYVEMACSSHNAMWERHAEALFAASHEWLNSARFNDESSGMMNLP
jgi:pimeloyl-ACP methyl ester carboxylesterase